MRSGEGDKSKANLLRIGHKNAGLGTSVHRADWLGEMDKRQGKGGRGNMTWICSCGPR